MAKAFYSISFRAQRVERATVSLYADSREEAEELAERKVRAAWGRYRSQKQTGVTDIHRTASVLNKGY